MKLYGKIMRVRGEARNGVTKVLWDVDCQPHVRIKLKRYFGRMATGLRDGRVRLPDTAEIAADLVWFMERYPMEVTQRKALDIRAQEHLRRAELVEDLIAKRRPPPHYDMAIAPRDYQRVAAAIVHELRGLLLGDDLGLGKTVSAITAISDPKFLPALVVTMTHLPLQWAAELKRFTPQLRVAIISSTTPYDLTDGRSRGLQSGLPFRFPDVVICNYHKLSGWADKLAGVVRSVVFDEIQELRRIESAKYAAAAQIAAGADLRLGLSGTPIYNYGGEIYNVLDVLRPGDLGSREEFVGEWCTAGEDKKARIKDARAFGSYMLDTGLMLRRTRAEVGRELPALQRIPHVIDANLSEIEKVASDAARLAETILRPEESRRGEKMMAAEEFSNKLRQATGIAKAPYVADFVRLLVESGEKVLLLGWHRKVYGIWQSKLADLKPVMYTGSETVAEKIRAKDAFVDGDAMILTMSLRSGAGLDGLQKFSEKIGRSVCRTVVFGELDWAFGVHEQDIGRVHRDGQTDPVTAYFLVSEYGSDPIVADVLGLKQAQLEGLRNPAGAVVQMLESNNENHIKRLAEAFLAQRKHRTEARA